MPYLEPERTLAGRLRVMTRAQLPLVICASIYFVGVLVAIPERLTSPLLLTGFIVLGAMTLLAVLLPWERLPADAVIVIPLVDIVAASLVRVQLIGVFPAAATLVVFPIVWIAYGFRPWAIWIAIVSAISVTVVPPLIFGRAPENALEWINVIGFPVFLVTISIGVGRAARALVRSREAAEQNAASLARALREVREGEVVSTAILDSVRAGLLLFGPEGQLRRANSNGRDFAERAGLNLEHPEVGATRLLLPDRRTRVPAADQPLPRAFRSAYVSDELVWSGNPGELHADLVTTRPVANEAGERLGTILAAADVTRLAEAVEVREQFVFTVSHELRTPLTSILGYLEVLRDAREEGDRELEERSLEIIERNASQLFARISELLASSAQRLQIDRVEVDIATLCGEVVEELQPRAEELGLELSFRSPEEPVQAMVDGGRVRQVVENLVSNALKFTRAGGRITVDALRDGEQIVLRVADTGVGMTSDERRQAFDRFFRGAHAHDNAIQGIGLGLSLSRLIAEAHGGTIELAPRAEGSGTVATVRLPRTPASAQWTRDPESLDA